MDKCPNCKSVDIIKRDFCNSCHGSGGWWWNEESHEWNEPCVTCHETGDFQGKGEPHTRRNCKKCGCIFNQIE